MDIVKMPLCGLQRGIFVYASREFSEERRA